MKTLPAILLCLAACSEVSKQDVSEPQFDIDDKSDSARAPRKGIDLRVTQLGQDSLSKTRGWVAHDIRLDGNTVDIDVTGDGASLDTIMYVFGPKRANGTYPPQPIAFNDDFEYPSNLGSHVVLAISQPGTYRVVVSSYDNYVAYPNNVTVAKYRVMVKCQDPAFGACGPAVSDQGGACWEDNDCLAVDGRPLHCEGEVTCAPGTNCFFTRQGSCVEDYAYMTYAPKQCSEPWRAVPDNATHLPIPELQKVVTHYKKLGIRIDEVGTLASPTSVANCTACGCSRGFEVVAKLTTPMAEKLAARGWTYSSANPPEQALEPVQCGQNPWQASTSPTLMTELQMVDAWLADNDVTARKRGFAWSAEPRTVCAACSCPRGDRLIVYAPDQEAHGILSSLGFDFLYVP